MSDWAWRRARFARAAEGEIPAVAGVYLVARAGGEGRRGWPRPIYAGRSVDLRRRFREHLRANNPNPIFREMTEAEGLGAEFWWVTLPRAQIAALERVLIGVLRPPGNRRL